MKTLSFGWYVRTIKRSGHPSECRPEPKRSSSSIFKLKLPERYTQLCFLFSQKHNTIATAVVFITFPLISDQHWSQDQGSDPDKHKGSFCNLFWRCPEDCLWVNGERLIPTLPEVGHLQNIAGLYIRISEDVNLRCCSKQDCKGV